MQSIVSQFSYNVEDLASFIVSGKLDIFSPKIKRSRLSPVSVYMIIMHTYINEITKHSQYIFCVYRLRSSIAIPRLTQQQVACWAVQVQTLLQYKCSFQCDVPTFSCTQWQEFISRCYSDGSVNPIIDVSLVTCG